MIRKFKIKAIRTDEYIVELDDELITQEWMAEFSSYMHKVDELEELAKDLAFNQLRFGNDRFFEGFGNVNRNGELPFSSSDFDSDGKWKPESERDQPTPGINIVVKSEDDDYEFEIDEEGAP